MLQVRWLVDDIRRACMREYSLGKYVTVDEMMIRYKGSYCPVRQYMPNKPEKWGIKVWCVADSTSKIVYNFEIYCGKDPIFQKVKHVLEPVKVTWQEMWYWV
jgi:hypothetical protein